LFKTLKQNGHEVWIYTTSFRSILSLKITFAAYNLYPSRFINGTKNQKELNKHNCKASKNPKLFGIDLHIDDSIGVELEGKEYGFDTFIISTYDTDWSEKIFDYLKLVK